MNRRRSKTPIPAPNNVGVPVEVNSCGKKKLKPSTTANASIGGMNKYHIKFANALIALANLPWL